METKTQKRKHQDDYENFIDMNFERIVDAFALNGFEVRNREDIDTYPRWGKRNYQVKQGSFATQVLDTGVSMLAVSGAVFKSKDIGEAARRLSELF